MTTSERRKSGRFIRKVGRKKSTYERSRASLSPSSSSGPSAIPPQALLGGRAGGEIPAHALLGGRAGGEIPAHALLGGRAGGEIPPQALLDGRAGGEIPADHVLGGKSVAGDDALRLSDWAAERLQLESVERENRKERAKEREERAEEREERAKEREERAEERKERVIEKAKKRDEREKERDERAKERDERAKERGEREKERDERAKERDDRAIERDKERDERAKERVERDKEREERAKEREERAKEREEARSMAALNTVDNLSSGMVGASATLVTSLIGLNLTEHRGWLLRLSLGVAGAFVLALNATVLAGIGYGLHRRVSPDTFSSLTLSLRFIVGALVLFIAIAVNFLYMYLGERDS